jgi:HlyD family secretion protein
VSALEAALAAEQRLLVERRSTRASQRAQLEERRTQVKRQIEGLGQRFNAFREEFAQASAELADFRALEGKGLIRRSVLRQSERDVSRLRGEIGDTEARIASARSQLMEAESKIAEMTLAARSEVLKQLQAVTAKLAEIEEERQAANDRLQRLDIRAPRTGHVNGLQVHTVGGIVGPGQKLMSIVPSSERLVVNAKVRPAEVDQVYKGSRATVRISSFRLPVTPELEGDVTNVSPDQVVDPQTGEAFFTIQVTVGPEERHKLHGKELTPGLPAEVLIRGDARRVITYLMQPLLDGMSVTFRER